MSGPNLLFAFYPVLPMTEGPFARDSESGLSDLPPVPKPVLGRSGKFKNPREPPMPDEFGPLRKSLPPKFS